MIRTAQKLLDAGFLIGLVFALFLAGKIVPYLIVVGVLPIAFFWKKSDYQSFTISPRRLFIPTLGYFIFCLALYYFYPGLPAGAPPPGNPDLELYAVALALLAVGFLRSAQISDLPKLFHSLAPYALLASFVVLSIYMILGIDGCRVKVAASWPFIPALMFTTLTFLLLLDWQSRTANQKRLRLVLIALSIVVVVGLTGARGVAVGQFFVLGCFLVLSLLAPLKSKLPRTMDLIVATALGIALTAGVGYLSSCNGLDRWPAITNTLSSSANFNPSMVTKAHAEEGPTAFMTSSTASEALSNSLERQTGAVDLAITQRLEMWQASIAAIGQAPLFGHGALSLKPIIQDRYGYEHNHNQYLAWLVTGGVVFLAVGLLFLATPIIIAKNLDLSNRLVLSLSVTGLWGVAMMFDAFLSLDFYLHYFSLLLGFLFVLVGKTPKKLRLGSDRA